MKKILVLCLLLLPASYAADKNTVYIYQDAGVSAESLLQTITTFSNMLAPKYLVTTINAQEVQQGTWAKNAILFIMPGGADLPYVAKLNGLGNQKLKQFVKNGGSFLGICAGAYYAASYVEFDKNGPLEVLGNRELRFFPGKAKGPILATYDYKTQSGSRAAQIHTVLDNIPQVVVYYNGGGFFAQAEQFPHTKIIATYKNKLPAIIAIRYGKGKVVLSGVHFEYDPALLDTTDPYIQKIREPLNKANFARTLLIKQLLAILI